MYDEVTIILPTRNEAQNIGVFLASVPREIRLIVVDASEDDTIDQVWASGRRMASILEYPCNVTHARQLGAQLARTPWLLFTDADVVFSPDYFARLPKIIHRSPSIGAAQTSPGAVYGPKLSMDAYRRHYRSIARGQALFDRLGIPAASGSNLLIHREAFEKVGGFDLDLTCNEDSEIAWRIRRAGYDVRYEPGLVVQARDHRRLRRGATRKALHSAARCFALYFSLVPARYRSSDWGYWGRSGGSGDSRLAKG